MGTQNGYDELYGNEQVASNRPPRYGLARGRASVMGLTVYAVCACVCARVCVRESAPVSHGCPAALPLAHAMVWRHAPAPRTR